MRKTLVAGNWKMNGTAAAGVALADGIVAGMPQAAPEVLVCPSFPYLATVAERLKGSAVRLGAQNVSEYDDGAYTGETSAAMLKDIGCEYVLVGHSERRSLLHESSADVAAKFVAAQGAQLIPVLCVGETLEQREAEQTVQVIDEQLEAVLDRAGIAAFQSAVVAYEPVWAIGTGRTATPEQAQEVHAHIRSALGSHDSAIAETTQILYGGSVKGDNAAGLFDKPDIDGGLIGGASLKPEDFLAIIEAGAQRTP